MTRSEYRTAARRKGLGEHALPTATTPDARAYERTFAPVRVRNVDPIVRPFDRIRDKRIGRQSIARPWASRPIDGGDVWTNR